MSSIRARVIVASVALVAVFGLGVFGWRWSGGARTQLAGWMEASATVAAVLAAVVAAWYGAQALDRERLRDEYRAAEQQAAQAQRVAVWLGKMPKGIHQVGYCIQNASSLPIYHVRLAVEDSEGEDRWENKPLDVVPPGLHERGMGIETGAAWAYTDTVRRHYEEEHAEARREAAARGQTIDDPPRPPETRVMVRFHDARGAHWERGFDGRLKLIWLGDDLPHLDLDEV